MKLLFVKLKHIGDALLLTPTITAARRAYPNATIWVVVRQGTEGILSGCPGIDRLLTTAVPESRNRRGFSWLNDLALLRQIRAERFDAAFDLSNGDRGRLLVGWSGATMRCASDGVNRVPWIWRLFLNRLSARDWSRDHQVMAGYNLVSEFLSLGEEAIPPLIFDRTFTASCSFEILPRGYAVIHPATRWQQKQWPLASWIEVGRHLLNCVPRVIVSTGPSRDEVEVGETIANALGARAIATRGSLSWAQMATLLYDARLFLGVDTAAMHLAAACECPVVALFGASVATHWRPWRVPHILVGAELEPGQKPKPAAMDHITAAEVVAACDAMLSSSVSDLRQSGRLEMT